MLKRSLKPFCIVVVLFAAVAAFVGIGVQAGGWATITVAELPDYFVAGQATQLSFTIRQHGVRLMDDLTPSLEAVNGTEKTTATVSREGANYHAKFTLPKPGLWTITIRSSFGANDVTLLPMQALAAHQAATAITDSERGRRLFVAKGCLQCHKNDNAGVNGRFPWATDLTRKHYSSAYLAQVLAEPQKALAPPKNDRMPNLNLKPNEIAALTVFLNAGKQTAKN
jgi:cytochrome c553